MSIISFLRRVLFRRVESTFTNEEVNEAGMLDALRSNDQAFQRVTKIREAQVQGNAKLAKAVERANSPFADLENLTNLTRDIRRKG